MKNPSVLLSMAMATFSPSRTVAEPQHHRQDDSLNDLDNPLDHNHHHHHHHPNPGSKTSSPATSWTSTQPIVHDRQKRKYIRRKPYLKAGVWIDPLAASPTTTATTTSTITLTPSPVVATTSTLTTTTAAAAASIATAAKRTRQRTSTPTKKIATPPHETETEFVPDDGPSERPNVLDELEQQVQDYNDSWENESLFQDAFAEMVDLENGSLADSTDRMFILPIISYSVHYI